MKFNVLITVLLFFILNSNLNSQIDVNNHKIIEFEFRTIEKNTKDILINSIIEISSGNKRIGIIQSDFEGISKFRVCSKKIINNQISLNIIGINCKPAYETIILGLETKYNLELEYGESKYKSNSDIRYIYLDLKNPDSDIIIEFEDDKYEHCDGRIRYLNEIPLEELNEWELIK